MLKCRPTGKMKLGWMDIDENVRQKRLQMENKRSNSAINLWL
jgi:hypothetical protein